MSRRCIVLLSFLLCVNAPVVFSQFPGRDSAVRTVAILPAHVDVKLQRNENRKVTPESIISASREMSFIVQAEIFHWFLEKQKRYHYKIALHDRLYSNDKLFAGGLSFEEYQKISPDSLARILQVDAVVFCNTHIVKELTEDEALGLNVLSFVVLGPAGVGLFGTTSVKFDLGLAENSAAKNIWPQEEIPLLYHNPSMDRILEYTLKFNAKKFPYRKK